MRAWRWSRFVVILLAAAAAAASIGCQTNEGENELSPTAHTYTLEGQVVQRMDPRIGRELLIDHEAIVGFIDEEGERTLMPPMTMSFPVAPEVPIDGLEPGTPIRFTLTLDWEGDPPYQITAIERLGVEG